MSLSVLTQVLASSSKEDPLVRHFLGVWPVVESILEAFSKATKLPIFVFFEGTHIFQSSQETLPPFCSEMLNGEETKPLCMEDGKRRAQKIEADLEHGIQLCHAGLINGRREIETGIGTVTILFGSKKSTGGEGLKRRHNLIKLISQKDADLAARLEQASESTDDTGDIESSELLLMDAISQIIQRLINATVGFRSLTINMAHELSLMLLGMGLLTQELGELLEESQNPTSATGLSNDLFETQRLVHTQCRLGLYIVRNFLSHASETRYKQVIRPRFEQVSLMEILDEMIDLHRLPAAKKHVFIESEITELPSILGSDMELRRLFNNILSNAIKYSYHSIPNARRTIKIRSKDPYDPGFKQRRFSIVFENYGLGLTDEERTKVFKPGFRGSQAIAEVPIGSGIGLSEAEKIMKLHKGEIRFHSKELYRAGEEHKTYLTSVDLIFRYGREGS